MRRHRTTVVALSALAALVVTLPLASCTGSGDGRRAEATTSSGSPTATPSGSTPPPEPTQVARIGVLATLSGDAGATGRGLRDSVELAVREANETGAVPGWRFEVVAVDDGGKQSEGQQVASRLSGTPNLLGVVGSMSSAVDEGVQPILNNAGVPLLAPAAGAAHLTRRTRDGVTVRPFPTYFRLAPTEAAEGPVAARFAAEADLARVVVVDDGSAYGRTFADGFRSEARRLGVEVVRSRTLGTDGTEQELTSSEARARAERIAAMVARVDTRLRDRPGRKKVDAVVLGGSADAAALLSEALVEQRTRVPMLGGDALLGSDLDSGDAARAGDHAVFPGVTAEAVDSAEPFTRKHALAGFDDDPGAFGPTGHDAATALLEAFGSVVGERTSVGSPLRADVVTALGESTTAGATGPLTFDGFGDRVAPRMTVFRLGGNGRWRAVRTVTAAP